MKNTALIGITYIATSIFSLVQASETQGNQLVLSLDTEYGSTDNFFYSDANKVSEQYWLISPLLKVQLQSERQQFSFETEIDHTKYQDFSEDDHSDVLIKPSYVYKFTQNSSFYIEGHWQQLYEDRGTGLSIGAGESLAQGDETTSTNVKVGYALGSEQSTGKFNVNIGQYSLEYDTRREQTYVLDQSKTFANVSFDYRLPSGTFIATDFNYQAIEFDNNARNDKDKWSVLVGAKWQKSAVSQFSALIGYQKISFKQDSFEDDSAVKWRVKWDWSPLDTIKFSLSSERDFSEANRLTDSYRLVDNYQMKVSSKLSDFFTLSGRLGLSNEEIVYIESNESEDFVNAGLTLEYFANQRLSIFARYEFHDLSTSGVTFPYQRNSFSLGFNVSI